MKLQHIQIGDRFEYEGKVFSKTGPITATSEEGTQRIIPRSAILKPAKTARDEARYPEKINRVIVLEAFETFYQDSTKHLDADAKATLENLRDVFLSAIEKQGQ